eukprot:CAMPEP_0181123964 /NCGR_PEP_ID=MMETSP1071-20121207/26207_1 /TAXON_ID=35127 /ORGANISM="Thalassiosira sp., Strain NH16" /LENGTH=62 /DNA_ID=CAMNT_0023209195 /DNA_START=493 /DNA_END=677 /DNA_ORIENTATION=-
MTMLPPLLLVAAAVAGPGSPSAPRNRRSIAKTNTTYKRMQAHFDDCGGGDAPAAVPAAAAPA